jgi:hypothetical protein
MEWDVVLFPISPIDGAYDALALTAGASLAQQFAVSFVWLGGSATSPGSQPFEVYRLDDGIPGPDPETGQTSPVPEPSTLLLLGSGMAVALRRRGGS